MSLKLAPSTLVVALASIALLDPLAVAQNGRPAPAEPLQQTRDADDKTENADAASAVVPAPRNSGPSRREGTGGMVMGLAFDDVSVDILIPWIVEITGKVVMPVRLQTLKGTKITLMNDAPVEKEKALDLLFQAFRLNDIGVIERDDMIILGPLTDVVSIRGDIPVLGPRDDVMGRDDRGTIVIKIFPVKKTRAEGIGDQLLEKFPDYASLTVDTNSNQIVVLGDIGLCQQVQRLINELDENYVNVKTETFRLRYADANEISTNILDLFETSGQSSTGSRQRTTGGAANRGRQAQQAARPGITPGPEVELRVTVNAQQNSVTVQAEPPTIEEIAGLIFEHWDRPRPEGTSKVYELAFTDPIKIRDLLQEVLGQGGGGVGSGARRPTSGARSGGAGTDVTSQLSGIYQIEAYADSNSLVVLCKTEESFDFLDSLVASLDQPTSVGLPLLVELKHANAVDVAEEVNALLAEAGQDASIRGQEEGLTGQGIGAAGDSAERRETGMAEEISFPWQRGRVADDRSPESALIGKIRVVPISRQNALAVVAPPHYRDSVIRLIEDFDRPGRQVMLSAVLAEVELKDDLALGLRFGQDLSFANSDNLITGNVGYLGTDDNPLNMFDMATLDVGFNVQVALQALDEKTNVRILQEPRVFTADNQEAIFFDGQDIPFITESFFTDNGALSQSFEYRQVGVFLNVRPRITAQQDVDLEINLELSNTVPGVTLFGGAIIDRRQTNTQIIVKNGQTIVLAGILREEESKIKRKVPLLGDIPVLGLAFTSIEDSTNSTELIFFITPTVVENPSENDANFNQGYRDRLLEIAKPLREQDQQSGPARRKIREMIYRGDDEPGGLLPEQTEDQ